MREVTGTILAAGDIVIDGPVDAEFIYGENVTLTGPFIKARAIAANNRLTINAPTLAADVVMAPHVVLTNGVRGRVTMLDSEVPCDKSGITGGFSYEEYDKSSAMPPLGRFRARATSANWNRRAEATPDAYRRRRCGRRRHGRRRKRDLLAFHMEEVGGEIIPPPPVEKPPPPPPPLDLSRMYKPEYGAPQTTFYRPTKPAQFRQESMTFVDMVWMKTILQPCERILDRYGTEY